MGTEMVADNKPAARWEEALPLGNGRMGAMVFGVPDRERIQLNEDSIWSGRYRDRNNPAAREALPVIRRLLGEGRVREAEELCLERLSGVPAAQRVYQTAGELSLAFSPDGGFGHPWSGTRGGPLLSGIRNYRRALDMARAVHTLSFEYQGTAFTRECFVSAPAGLMVLRLSAAGLDGAAASGRISFRACLERGVFCDRIGNTEDSAFLARDGDIPFCAMIKVVHEGGKLHGAGGFLTLEGADEALLFADIRTGFREADCAAACVDNIHRAAALGWGRLLEDHVGEFRSVYGRMKLELGEAGDDGDCGGDGDDDCGGDGDDCGADAAVRYYNFCRYILVSSSRPGTLPANLQGIWNPHMDPPWGSDYTININTQMNYWPACMCNLAETEEPLFDLLERMYPNGKKTAELMYGCRGFVAHHNTDIWGDTAPRDYWIPASYWTLGAAWLCLHMWEHYEYTLDRRFLEKYFYLLKESCLFFVDFLTPCARRNEAGEYCLVVSPSVSPENSYLLGGDACSLSAGCEMDNQILRKLFESAVRGAAILGLADDDIKQFRSILGRIPGPAIGRGGTICEWNEEYEEAEPGHRHFSHLWALWPGDSITIDETPDLAAAARKSLERRLAHSGGHTGWSRAWLVNFMARLGDGEAALKSLDALLSDFTLPNLFNNGPPFQIDGNFGALAGITQMLVQSRIRYDSDSDNDNDCAAGFKALLYLLPALPGRWPSGRLHGVRVKGNLELDFEWHERRLISLVARNNGAAAVTVLIRCNSNNNSNNVNNNDNNEWTELVLPPGETPIDLT